MVRIDKSRCIGCRICENICHDGFKVINGVAEVINGEAACVEEAANKCPRGAIILDGEKENKEEQSNEKFKEDSVRGFGRGQGRGMGKGRGMRRGQGRKRRVGW